MVGIGEIIIIALFIVLFFTGGKKLNDIARSLGRFTTEYKKGKMEAEEELKRVKEETDNIKKDIQ